jgi:hypothetical protein
MPEYEQIQNATITREGSRALFQKTSRFLKNGQEESFIDEPLSPPIDLIEGDDAQYPDIEDLDLAGDAADGYQEVDALAEMIGVKRISSKADITIFPIETSLNESKYAYKIHNRGLNLHKLGNLDAKDRDLLLMRIIGLEALAGLLVDKLKTERVFKPVRREAFINAWIDGLGAAELPAEAVTDSRVSNLIAEAVLCFDERAQGPYAARSYYRLGSMVSATLDNQPRLLAIVTAILSSESILEAPRDMDDIEGILAALNPKSKVCAKLDPLLAAEGKKFIARGEFIDQKLGIEKAFDADWSNLQVERKSIRRHNKKNMAAELANLNEAQRKFMPKTQLSFSGKKRRKAYRALLLAQSEGDEAHRAQSFEELCNKSLGFVPRHSSFVCAHAIVAEYRDFVAGRLVGKDGQTIGQMAFDQLMSDELFKEAANFFFCTIFGEKNAKIDSRLKAYRKRIAASEKNDHTVADLADELLSLYRDEKEGSK